MERHPDDHPAPTEQEEWEYVNVGRCPQHGDSLIVRSYSSRGSDPYSIDVLECGDHVMAFSAADEDLYIVSSSGEKRDIG
jgi:hypothetical protein